MRVDCFYNANSSRLRSAKLCTCNNHIVNNVTPRNNYSKIKQTSSHVKFSSALYMLSRKDCF